MIAKLSLAALVLALAVPGVAQTNATITQGPADKCADTGTATGGAAAPADCAAAKPGKLGTNIIPLAATDGGSEGTETEGGDED